MVAAKMANMKSSERVGETLKEDLSGSREPHKPQISNAMAAAQLGVGVASIKPAKRVLKSGDQDLIDAVEQGEVAVGVAAPDRQPTLHDRGQDGEPKRWGERHWFSCTAIWRNPN